MKKIRKRLLSLIMALAMVMSLGVTALADEEQAIDGTGELEGYVDPSEIKVQLPVNVDLSFFADPQQLVYKTTSNSDGKAAYQGMTIDPTATVLFANRSDGDIVGYSGESDHFKIKNQGMCALAIECVATLTASSDGVLVTSDATFTDITEPAIYIALCSDGGSATALLDGEDGTTISGDVLPANPENVFSWKYDASRQPDGYYADILPESSGSGFFWPTMEYYLTASANSNANWNNARTAVPSVNLLWKVTNPDLAEEEEEAAPVIGPAVINIAYNANNVTAKTSQLENFEGYTVKSFTFGEANTAVAAANYTYNANTGVLTITNSYLKFLASSRTSRAHTLTMTKDGVDVTITVNVNYT